jgi:hypothetical protein
MGRIDLVVRFAFCTEYAAISERERLAHLRILLGFRWIMKRTTIETR